MGKDATAGPRGGPVKLPGLTLRGFDDAGNEIVPQEIRFVVTGGSIDFGDAAVPHLGRLVQGVFKGRVKGGKFEQVDSRWILVMKIAVEAASAREIPDEDVEGTIQQAAAGSDEISVRRAGRSNRRRPEPEPAEPGE